VPFNSRDMWVYLKAQDLATRALNSFGRSVRSAGNDVRIAQIEAEQASLRAQLAQGRLTGMTNQNRAAIQNHIATLEAEKTQLIANDAALANRMRNMERMQSVLRSTAQVASAMGFTLGAIGVGGALAMKNLVESSIEYQRQVALTSTQVQGFSGNFKELADIGLRTADTIGVHFQDIQPALYDIFSSMEVGTKDAEKLLQAFSKGAVAGQTSIEDVSRATIGLMNAFHRPMGDVNHLLDLQFALVREGIGTYAEWNQRIGLVTPSAVRAGQSIEMMVAALATATRMGLSAARAGTSVARAMDAMSHPVAVANMKALGVNARDAAGNMRPLNDILRDLRTKIMALPEKDRLAALLDVFKGAGGTIEARRFIQNIVLGAGNLELFDNILKDVSGSSGAMENAYKSMADTTAVKSELLKNKWMELKIGLGDALIPAVDRLLGYGQRLLDWFNGLSPKTKELAANFLALATAVGLVGGPMLIVGGMFSQFLSVLIAAGPELLIVAGIIAAVAAAVALIAGAFYLAWTKSAPFRDLIKDIGGTIREVWVNDFEPFFKGVAADFKAYIEPPLRKISDLLNNNVVPTVKKFWDEFWMKHGGDVKEILNDIKMLVENGFKFLGNVLNTFLLPILRWVLDQYHQHKQAIDGLIHFFEFLGKWILIIAGAAGLILLGSAFLILVAIIGIVAAVIGGLIWLVGEIWQGIKILVGWLKEAWHWFENLATTMREKATQAAVAVSEKIGELQTWFSNLPGNITHWLGDLGHTLYQAGKDLIQGLIDGIRSMWQWVQDEFHRLTDKFKDWKGPPSKDRMLLFNSGKLVMEGFSNGIDSAVPALKNKLEKLTSSISPTVNANIAAPAPNYGQKIIYQTIHITTNEINPRVHAEKLGSLLAGSM